MLARKLYDFTCDLSLSDNNNNESELNNCFKDLFCFKFTIFETLNGNFNFDKSLISKLLIWDDFSFIIEKNPNNQNDQNLIAKEIFFKKKIIELMIKNDLEIKNNRKNIDYNNCNVDAGDLDNIDINILGKLIENRNKNFTDNLIITNNQKIFNDKSKKKYLRLNINFDLNKLDRLNKIFSSNKNIKNSTKNIHFNIYNNNNNPDNLIEDYFGQTENKKIYVFLLDYFITFSKKLFVFYNHINYKVYFNNEKHFQGQISISEKDYYKLIYEEIFDNIARVDFSNLANFLSEYFKIEKENIFKAKGDYMSVIICFCDYKTMRKDECNNLEVLFVAKNNINNNKNILIGEEFLVYFYNFIEENVFLKNYFAKFDITFENPEAFVSKINTNNPFKREISYNFLESNQVDSNFLNEPKFKYVKIEE